MEVGFKTDRGRVRSNNEDACYVMPRDKVFVVADGVGGSKSGEIASRTCVNGIVGYVRDHPLSEMKTQHDIREYFNRCIKDVNFTVLESSQRYEENRGMATTVVVSYVHNNMLHIVNVGDSRCYVYRQGELTQITEDHTYVNSLVKAGVITRKQARKHENKNMITRAIGAEYRVEADQFVTPVSKGDIVLMCTDGLYDELSSEEISAKLGEEISMSDMCCDLIDMANEHGGNDNITVICLKVTEDDADE
ncbi:Stp1/IreP family PP2C-type Ser/Thr phosphatase [Eubacterium sp. AB3007]|uniref:Stp1/IreP family PP2C-type Ser/Thr phosphatase n=1 Tax=Eubacterium sp. AB3007 TaxID=1392487 RepID=UPI0004853E0E|nr:Stp1/IreP family PP2C-type Ser/Thr phosphatase [Eubacterium sp. AB3007]